MGGFAGARRSNYLLTMNDSIHDALATMLEYVGHTTNLADPMLVEIKSAHEVLSTYLNLFN